jgi:hypothetical protein
MWTSSGGSSLGKPCRRETRLGPCKWGASRCRRSRVRWVPTPRTPPATPTGGGTGSGSTSGTRWRCHSRRSPVEGRRGGIAGRGALSSWQNKLEIIGAELQKFVQQGLDGVWVFHTSSTIGSPRWWKGHGRCGCTPARQTPTMCRQRSWRRMKSGADSIGCCD